MPQKGQARWERERGRKGRRGGRERERGREEEGNEWESKEGKERERKKGRGGGRKEEGKGREREGGREGGRESERGREGGKKRGRNGKARKGRKKGRKEGEEEGRKRGRGGKEKEGGRKRGRNGKARKEKGRKGRRKEGRGEGEGEEREGGRKRGREWESKEEKKREGRRERGREWESKGGRKRGRGREREREGGREPCLGLPPMLKNLPGSPLRGDSERPQQHLAASHLSHSSSGRGQRAHVLPAQRLGQGEQPREPTCQAPVLPKRKPGRAGLCLTPRRFHPTPQPPSDRPPFTYFGVLGEDVVYQALQQQTPAGNTGGEKGDGQGRRDLLLSRLQLGGDPRSLQVYGVENRVAGQPVAGSSLLPGPGTGSGVLPSEIVGAGSSDEEDPEEPVPSACACRIARVRLQDDSPSFKKIKASCEANSVLTYMGWEQLCSGQKRLYRVSLKLPRRSLGSSYQPWYTTPSPLAV
ncbi:Octapeptide-repeat protein T2, partial [Ophiophagus hannah]